MNFWEQFLLSQASAALHAVEIRYGAKYLTIDEQAAVSVVIDALIDLPRRIQQGGNQPIAMQTFPVVPAHAEKKGK